jgi:hypothetical protein
MKPYWATSCLVGMRQYVLVVLKTGPNKLPAGPERDAMFKGHFANSAVEPNLLPPLPN